MDEPLVAAEKEEKHEKHGGHGKHGTDRLSLWIGLGVLVLGVVGQILVDVLPGRYFIQSELGEVFYDRYQLLAGLRIAAESATYLGVVWVGVFLARWGVCKKHC
jgi:hypothetical protein